MEDLAVTGVWTRSELAMPSSCGSPAAGTGDVDAAVLGALASDAAKIAEPSSSIRQSDLDALLTRLHLPARLYNRVHGVLAAVGLGVEPDPEADGEDGLDDDCGWNADGLALFLDKARHKLLTADEEVELAKQIEAGALAHRALAEAPGGRLNAASVRELKRRVRTGDEAKNAFALANVRLVVKLAGRNQGRGVELDDLIQEGWIGLAHAVEKFDYRKGFKFSTYATWWIRQAIARAIDDKGRAIRLPAHVAESLRSLLRTRDVLTAQLERTPTVEEIAGRATMPVATARRLLSYEPRPASLDASFRGSNLRLVELLAAPPWQGPEILAEAQDDVRLVNDLLAELTPKEAEIIRRRNGIGTGRSETLEEIGADFGVTRERIRQIEAKAMSKLEFQAYLMSKKGNREP